MGWSKPLPEIVDFTDFESWNPGLLVGNGSKRPGGLYRFPGGKMPNGGLVELARGGRSERNFHGELMERPPGDL